LKNVDQFLTFLWIFSVVELVGTQLLRIDLEKFDAICPVHIQRFGQLTNDVSVLRALYSPVHLVQDPDIG
jgi:hypothetical protein